MLYYLTVLVYTKTTIHHYRPTFPGHPREIYITRQEQVVLVYTKPTFYIWKECLAQPFQGTHEKSTLRDKSKLATATCSQGNHLLFKYFYCLSCIFFDLIWCLENIHEAKKRWMWQPYLCTLTHGYACSPSYCFLSCPKVLRGRVCLTIKSFMVGDHFLHSPQTNEWFGCGFVRRN